LGFGLLLGGALSNLYDRLANGFVIDYLFIKLPFFQLAFNIADCAILAGVLIIAIDNAAQSKNREDEFSRLMMDENQKTYDLIADTFAETRKKPLWEELYVFKQYLGLASFDAILEKTEPCREPYRLCTANKRRSFDNGVRQNGKPYKKHIIDIGCGSGRLLPLFKGMNIDYTGIDNSKKLLELAREKGKGAQFNGKCEFANASILALPFLDNSFDCAFMIACLNHIPQPLQLTTLKEARRVLAPSGILCMTNFNLLRFSFTQKTVWRYGSFPNVITRWQGHPLYYYAFTLSKLKRLCRAAGLRIVHAYYSRNGVRAHWWNGRNIVVIARK
jgi:SAM-dependent methyltransferase